jgi:glycosyltransferase involved in cell wall biosynthesis
MKIAKEHELDIPLPLEGRFQDSVCFSRDCAVSHAHRPIRVLAFLEARTIAGAVKPVLEFVAQAAETPAEGIEVTLISFLRREPENELTQTIHARGIPLKLIEERYPFDFKIVGQLRDLIRRQRPDIIWTNNSKSHFLVHVTGADRSARWIAFHHGYTKEALRSRIYNQLDRWSLRYANRVITVCQKFVLDLQDMGVPIARVSVGRNPIRPVSEGASAESKEEVRDRLGLDTSSTVLLSVGRLSPEKGHLDLLMAVSTLKATYSGIGSLKLFIVGSGPLRERLEKVSNELGLNDIVTFTGYRPDVESYYVAADVFVLPSHSEGCPNVLLEAMAAGLPVVATDAGGIPEIAINGLNALVVPRRSPSQLAIALETLLSNAGLRRRLADASREVVQRHSPTTYFQEITAIFHDVLRESRCDAVSNVLYK